MNPLLHHCYKILGATEFTSDSDLKKIYRNLAMKYHPDVNRSSQAKDYFINIQKAYQYIIEWRANIQYQDNQTFSYSNKQSQQDKYETENSHKAHSNINRSDLYNEYVHNPNFNDIQLDSSLYQNILTIENIIRHLGFIILCTLYISIGLLYYQGILNTLSLIISLVISSPLMLLFFNSIKYLDWHEFRLNLKFILRTRTFRSICIFIACTIIFFTMGIYTFIPTMFLILPALSMAIITPLVHIYCPLLLQRVPYVLLYPFILMYGFIFINYIFAHNPQYVYATNPLHMKLDNHMTSTSHLPILRTYDTFDDYVGVSHISDDNLLYPYVILYTFMDGGLGIRIMKHKTYQHIILN